MGGRTRAPYPSGYKAELVRLVREAGRSPSELAREFDPSAQSSVNWELRRISTEEHGIAHSAIQLETSLRGCDSEDHHVDRLLKRQMARKKRRFATCGRHH